MDQHPIPRQITTFEFKLIGFMTLKQFLFLVIFAPVGYIVYSGFPGPFILKVLAGAGVGAIGAAFAFITIQDRPLDIWIKNFIKRLNSPSQYFYSKKGEAVYFLKDLFFLGDPHLTMVHVESKQMLTAYLKTKNGSQSSPAPIDSRDSQKTHIQDLLSQNIKVPQFDTSEKNISAPSVVPPESIVHEPFITGVVKNRRQISIPGILVTIKEKIDGRELRILKTNPYGIFATYSPLPTGDYILEIGDPNGNYFFDTMNVHVDLKNSRPFVIYSKEIL